MGSLKLLGDLYNISSERDLKISRDLLYIYIYQSPRILYPAGLYGDFSSSLLYNILYNSCSYFFLYCWLFFGHDIAYYLFIYIYFPKDSYRQQAQSSISTTAFYMGDFHFCCSHGLRIQLVTVFFCINKIRPFL